MGQRRWNVTRSEALDTAEVALATLANQHFSASVALQAPQAGRGEVAVAELFLSQVLVAGPGS
jgi:hypothetical protein